MEFLHYFTNDIVLGEILKEIKHIIRSNLLWQKTDSKIIFVCGAQKNNENISYREIFLEYAQKHLKDYRFFRAEDVFYLLSGSTNKDLLTLEKQFSEYSDCIILILESDGAKAELGAFSVNNEIACKVLVVNDIEFIGGGSFISDGPIKKLDKVSKFKPTIYSDYKPILSCIDKIEERLSKIKSKNRSKQKIPQNTKFKNLAPKFRLFIVSDIVTLFSPIRKSELEFVLNNIFFDKFVSNNEIDTEIGLLHSLGLIYSVSDPKGSQQLLIKKSNEKEMFYDFNDHDNSYRIRAKVVQAYRKNFRERSIILANRT